KARLGSDPEFGSRSPSDSIAPQDEQTPRVPSFFARMFSYISFLPEASGETKPKPPTSDKGVSPPNIMASVWALQGAISVVRSGQGHILSISATSVDPTQAARI